MSTANDQEETVRAIAEIRRALLACEEPLAFLRGRVADPAALAALHDLLMYRALDATEALFSAEQARLHEAEIAALAEREKEAA
jgi:hypothetical protein